MPPPLRLDRTLISVTGPEARSFLQNLLTQDVDKLDSAPVIYAALLSPQGKVSADMLLWAREDSVLIECAPSRGDDLFRRLSLYKLRANAQITDLTRQLAVVLHLDSAADGAVADPRMPDGAVADPRMPDGALGWRRIVTREDADILGRENGELFARRLALGVPDLSEDAAPDEVFALEGLLEELNGVDFKKGCFVGQENVSRMKRRATTRKKFCPLALEAPTPPARGAAVRAGEAEIGEVRAATAGRALALLRLDRAQEAAAAGVTLTCEGHPVRLDPPPWLILP